MDATILIVEDEQNINDILAFTFSKEGYKTISAYDGIKGYEMAMNDNPDLTSGCNASGNGQYGGLPKDS